MSFLINSLRSHSIPGRKDKDRRKYSSGAPKPSIQDTDATNKPGMPAFAEAWARWINSEGGLDGRRDLIRQLR